MGVDNKIYNYLNAKDFVNYIKFVISNSNDYEDIEKKLHKVDNKNADFNVKFFIFYLYLIMNLKKHLYVI